MNVPSQLALDLRHRKAFRREDFLVSPVNTDAVAWIDRWPNWPGRALGLFGPSQCGKTHLAHVFQAYADASFADVTSSLWPMDAVGSGALIIEGADLVDEHTLLHVMNFQREQGGTLLMTADLAPAQWGTDLADLASRLSALPAVGIAPPDDALLAGVLVKHFNDRQLAVSPNVVRYVAARIERSFTAVAHAAQALDEASVSSARAPTIHLARKVLGLGAPEKWIEGAD